MYGVCIYIYIYINGLRAPKGAHLSATCLNHSSSSLQSEEMMREQPWKEARF